MRETPFACTTSSIQLDTFVRGPLRSTHIRICSEKLLGKAYCLGNENSDHAASGIRLCRDSQIEERWISSGGRLSSLSFRCVVFFGAVGTSLRASALHVVVIDTKSFVNLGAQSSIVINPETSLVQQRRRSRNDLQSKKFRVVHLQQHTSDLASKFWLQLLDLGIDGFTKHLLLLAWRQRG